MTQKPVHTTARAREPHGHQAIWEAIRAFGDKTWSRRDLLSIGNQRTTDSFLERLEKAGFIAVAAPSDVVRDIAYTLVRDIGHHAPKLRQDGQPSKRGSGTENMWRSMRLMKEFDAREIQIHSTTDEVTISEDTAKSYCRALMAAGYLRVIVKAKPGVRAARYRLIRCDGPLPPMIQRVKQVFDPNSRKSYPMGGAK